AVSHRLAYNAPSPNTVSDREGVMRKLFEGAIARTVAVWAFVLFMNGTMPAVAQSADRSSCYGADPNAAIVICTDLLTLPNLTAQDRVIAYAFRGLAYIKTGDYDRAIRDYDEAIRLDPKFVRAYEERGAAYSWKGDYDRAIRDYDEAIRLDPKY